MFKTTLQIILFNFLLFGLELDSIQSFNNWNNLQTGKISIDWCTYNNFPISRAKTIIDHPINAVAIIVQDLDNYPTLFERVTKTIRLEQNVVQIVLDMPFPFDGRDYIVKYNIKNFNNRWVFSFSSINHPRAELESNHVRLPNAAGIWILNKLNENQTEVTYAWNGELLGNFPDIGLTRAWVTQGNEVLHWLEKGLIRKSSL